ncbi:uncharacterized protein BO87DRAFT_150608 [Aspergillus neoniger CBS 115656]|uniref:Transmembrane protein n=1 Tax=Aspergillus neoniger (strain CBS 115656) TaxID=1448310 RepID=A0A318YR53_ASPNB|nr:hypothetical protein BO87DRAFT_150608 [Aspergillus neoniger CBS 115656]PYH30588.1 hypothetical protein BO87DRAFT_150608 [Aspergillus neoniger CBS 115656]
MWFNRRADGLHPPRSSRSETRSIAIPTEQACLTFSNNASTHLERRKGETSMDRCVDLHLIAFSPLFSFFVACPPFSFFLSSRFRPATVSVGPLFQHRRHLSHNRFHYYYSLTGSSVPNTRDQNY